MHTLWLTDRQIRAILDHVRAESPREACGVIVGKGERAHEVIPIPNVAPEPLQHYDMDPQALAAVFTRLDQSGQELVGFYHSHPAGDPIPSPTDIAQATYPRTAYLIVGLRNMAAPQFAAWTMNQGEVRRLRLHIGDQQVDGPDNEDEGETLSPAQRFAIIVAAVLAFAILIGLSLYLLPPAPIITP